MQPVDYLGNLGQVSQFDQEKLLEMIADDNVHHVNVGRTENLLQKEKEKNPNVTEEEIRNIVKEEMKEELKRQQEGSIMDKLNSMEKEIDSDHDRVMASRGINFNLNSVKNIKRK